MKNLLHIILCFTALTTQAQNWKRVEELPKKNIYTLETINGTLYAAIGNTLHVGNNGGTNWIAYTIEPKEVLITAIAMYHNKLYVGTDNNGVFSTADSGKTWLNTGSNLLTVVSFTELNNTLYAATLGSGIFRLNTTNNVWDDFNTALPNYSFNVNKIITANGSLLAPAGANGTFYQYDFVQNQWEEKFYFSNLRPGLMCTDIVVEGSRMFAVVIGTKIINSDDNGKSWVYDTAGLKTGLDKTGRVFFAGADKHYTAINQQSAGTWIQQRDKNASVGTSWAANTELLPGVITFSMRGVGNTLFLATDSGLYSKNIASPSAINTPQETAATISIFPNPSTTGTVTINSKNTIDEIQITNTTGKIVYKAANPAAQLNLTLLPSGLYFVYLKTNQNIEFHKFIITE